MKSAILPFLLVQFVLLVSAKDSLRSRRPLQVQHTLLSAEETTSIKQQVKARLDEEAHEARLKAPVLTKEVVEPSEADEVEVDQEVEEIFAETSSQNSSVNQTAAKKADGSVGNNTNATSISNATNITDAANATNATIKDAKSAASPERVALAIAAIVVWPFMA
ncbi:unnamed protein product [Effrenium voratum]|nr:unnamed protein product [Effrenium voratum]